MSLPLGKSLLVENKTEPNQMKTNRCYKKCKNWLQDIDEAGNLSKQYDIQGCFICSYAKSFPTVIFQEKTCQHIMYFDDYCGNICRHILITYQIHKASKGSFSSKKGSKLTLWSKMVIKKKIILMRRLRHLEMFQTCMAWTIHSPTGNCSFLMEMQKQNSLFNLFSKECKLFPFVIL